MTISGGGFDWGMLKMNRKALRPVTTVFILTFIYTITITNDYYDLANILWVNIALFITATFILSLALLTIIVGLLQTDRFKNIRHFGLLAILGAIGILVIEFREPLQLFYNRYFLPLWIVWIIIVLYLKLGRNNRYRWLALPVVAYLALFIFHQFIPYVSCNVSGGDWVRGGLLGQAQYCRYEYPDAEQICTSSDECLGGCFVGIELPVDKPVESGYCKATTSPFGCYASIEFPDLEVCTD
jgi:hypothetical protein